jgi:hypothetical protein
MTIKDTMRKNEEAFKFLIEHLEGILDWHNHNSVNGLIDNLEEGCDSCKVNNTILNQITFLKTSQQSLLKAVIEDVETMQLNADESDYDCTSEQIGYDHAVDCVKELLENQLIKTL